MRVRSDTFRGMLLSALAMLPLASTAGDMPAAKREAPPASEVTSEVASAPTDASHAEEATSPRRDAKPAWPSPADRELAVLTALRENNFADLVLATGGLKAYRRMSRDWERESAEIEARRAQKSMSTNDGVAEDPTEPDEFDTAWTLLQTDEGVETLIREWQAKLAESAQSTVIQFNTGVAAIASELSDASDLTPEEQAQQQALLLAVQAWANRTDFSNPTPLRRVVQAMATEARATGAETIEDLKLLPFDHAMAHGDGLLRVARVAMEAYGLDPDDALRSVRISEVARDGERVKVRYEARFLGVALAQETVFQPYYGEWREVGEIAQGLSEDDGIDAAAAAAERATPAAPATDSPDASTSSSASPPVGKCSIDTTAPVSEGKS